MSSSRGRKRGEVGAEGVVDLAGDVALEAADDLFLAEAFGDAALGVGAGASAGAQPTDGDQGGGAVGVAVAAAVEPVSGGAAGGGVDRAGAVSLPTRLLHSAQCVHAHANPPSDCGMRCDLD